MNENEERIYMDGEASTLKNMITYCQNKLRAYGIKLKTKDEFDQERIEIISLLRMHCDEYGDNDWDDNLHLSDIIDKHLMRHIEQRVSNGL